LVEAQTLSIDVPGAVSVIAWAESHSAAAKQQRHTQAAANFDGRPDAPLIWHTSASSHDHLRWPAGVILHTFSAARKLQRGPAASAPQH
jgi:hypothetical protein